MTLIAADIQIDQAQERSARGMLREVKNGYARAVGQATRSTTTTVRVRIVRAVAEKIAVAQNKLYQRRNFRRRPITDRLSWRNGLPVGGAIRVGLGRMPLGRFKPKQHWKAGKSRGRVRSRVSYKINRGGKRKQIRDAFAVEFKSGYVGLFRGFSRRGGRRELDESDELYGPSVPQVASQHSEVRRLLGGSAAGLYADRLGERVAALHRRAALRN